MKRTRKPSHHEEIEAFPLCRCGDTYPRTGAWGRREPGRGDLAMTPGAASSVFKLPPHAPRALVAPSFPLPDPKLRSPCLSARTCLESRPLLGQTLRLHRPPTITSGVTPPETQIDPRQGGVCALPPAGSGWSESPSQCGSRIIRFWRLRGHISERVPPALGSSVVLFPKSVLGRGPEAGRGLAELSSHCRCGVARFVGYANHSLAAVRKRGEQIRRKVLDWGSAKRAPARVAPRNEGERERTAKRRKTRIRNEMRKERRNLRPNPVG